MNTERLMDVVIGILLICLAILVICLVAMVLWCIYAVVTTGHLPSYGDGGVTAFPFFIPIIR